MTSKNKVKQNLGPFVYDNSALKKSRIESMGLDPKNFKLVRIRGEEHYVTSTPVFSNEKIEGNVLDNSYVRELMERAKRQSTKRQRPKSGGGRKRRKTIRRNTRKLHK
jgi:hypothetical protein